MDLLKAEIARKRKHLEEKKVIKEGQKYFKRGDLAAAEREEYLQKAQESAAKRQKYEPSGPPTEGKLRIDVQSSSAGDELTSPTEMVSNEVLLPRAEAVRRLRERGEPIRLFGETDEDVCRRLRRIEILTPDVNKGLRNDFQAAMEKIEQDEQRELLQRQDGEKDVPKEMKVDGGGLTMKDIEALAEKALEGDEDYDQGFVLKYIKFLLELRAKDLNDRPKEVKTSQAGRLDAALHEQTIGYLRPLLKLLRKRKCPPDILRELTDICKNMVAREYVKASDSYLRMAIGNAAWPIGVTMVGIHARAGREKIFAQHVAHVLNDETQRKYIQGLKRLMTYCQKVFPTDPSRCVRWGHTKLHKTHAHISWKKNPQRQFVHNICSYIPCCMLCI